MDVSRKTRFARLTVLTSFGLLVLALLLHRFWLVLPLLLFAWGLWREDWRSHIWLCFVLLFYFLLNINELANQATVRAWLECGLIVLLFSSAMLYCRWVKQIPAAEVVHNPPVESSP